MKSILSYSFRGIALPAETKEVIDNYVEYGMPTGSFLQAVIENDLKAAFDRADEKNAAAMQAIVAYFYNYCPAGCWGFAGAFRSWTEAKLKERDAKLKERNGNR